MPLVHASDGCALHYDVLGEGKPILLIPGLGGTASFWSGVAQLLSRSHRTIAVDHRGAGRNGRPEGRYSIGQIADDVLTVMNAENIGAAHVVGHSTGGAVAQTLAIDAPARVDKLVLSATWSHSDEHFRQLFQARLDVLLKAGPACYQRLTHVLGYTPDYLNAHAAELEKAVSQAATTLAPLSVAAARIRMLLEFDRAADLGRITKPCLVLGVTDDAVVPFHHSQHLAASIPGAELVAVNGGHFHPRTQPDRFADLLQSLRSDRLLPTFSAAIE
jgi:aminoacrylate hydrolase